MAPVSTGTTSKKSGVKVFSLVTLGLILILAVIFVNNTLQIQEETKATRGYIRNLHFLPPHLRKQVVEVINRDSTEDSTHEWGQPVQGTNFVIYYNAIPKTGCRSIARAAAFLSATQAMDTRFKLTILPEAILFNEGLIRQYVRQVHPPAIIGGHAIFVPFSAPQAYSSSIPVKYVNVLRDPLDRLISHYYFEQNGDSVHQASFFKVGKKMSLDDCLHDEVCKNKSYDKILTRTINQLCGARPHCGTLSRRAMLTAKRNVNRYTVIGLTEQLNTTVLLLEKMFPSMMKGLHSYFRKTEVASLKKFKTLDKLAPSPATLEILRRDLAFEYEVYDDVKRKFDQLKAEMGL